MSDTTLNRYVGEGDDAVEAAFTPNPSTAVTAPALAVLFVNSENPAVPILKWWDGSAFLDLANAGATGTVTNTGTLTDHAVIVGNGGVDVSALASLGTAGQVLTSAGAGADPAWANAPGRELAYVEFTGNVSITATTEATANSVVSAGAVTFDGATAVIIEFFTPVSQPGATAASSVIYYLYADAASIGQIGQHLKQSATTERVPVYLRRRLTPGAASITYSIRAARATSDGTVFGGAGGLGAVVPGYIRITVA